MPDHNSRRIGARYSGAGVRIFSFALLSLSLVLPTMETAHAAETFDGTTVGFTEDGYPFRGDPDAAVTLIEYSDYLCPYCARHYQQTLPALLEKYVRTGRVKLVFHDYPIVSLHPDAAKASAAALCVGEQSAAKFWAMHDKIFESRARWAQTSPDVILAELAEAVGADMPAYNECIDSGLQQARVENAVAASQELGFVATPSFRFVNNATGDSYTFSGAHPIDIVDVGLPNRTYDLNSAQAWFSAGTGGGQEDPLPDVRKSEFVSVGIEVHLGPHTIQPGSQGTLHVRVNVREMVYPDSQDENYASVEFAPTFYDSKYVQGENYNRNAT